MRKTDIVTKKDYFSEIAAMFGAMDGTAEFFTKGDTVIRYSDVQNFLENEIALLGKKAAYKSTKPTKTQEANILIKEKILEVLKENGGKMAIKEICAKNEALKDLTSSKMSAMLTQLVKDGKVEKTYEKKVAYFSRV